MPYCIALYVGRLQCRSIACFAYFGCRLVSIACFAYYMARPVNKICLACHG